MVEHSSKILFRIVETSAQGSGNLPQILEKSNKRNCRQESKDGTPYPQQKHQGVIRILTTIYGEATTCQSLEQGISIRHPILPVFQQTCEPPLSQTKKLTQRSQLVKQ